jgi:hypothetical protein
MIPRNSLSNMTDAQRKEKYISDLKKNDYTLAYSENNSNRPLINTDVNKVEFIGGLWRIQRDFDYKITLIRKKDFVIGDMIDRSKLPKEEIPIFDYYKAAMVGLNCWGYSIDKFDRFLANCGKAWGYGKTIPEARDHASCDTIDIITKNDPVMCAAILQKMSKLK